MSDAPEDMRIDLNMVLYAFCPKKSITENDVAIAFEMRS
jgi:hypothetical protein